MNADEKQKRSPISERITMAAILLVIVLLFAFFLKDIMIPLFRMQLENNTEGASELLTSKGIKGGISVILIEALQMVVVFVPAEFIQISSGLSYPLYVALPLCDAGVCLGATIIFMLVRLFSFSSKAYEKRRGMIDRIASGSSDRNTVLLLYLLFFMPLIPFGAICYYGSSRKISYGKYILTVATGVIPSILVSNGMGRAGMAFLTNHLPFWLLILIIVLLAALLFVLIAVFMRRFIFKGTDGTPDSPVVSVIFFLIRIWQCGRKKPVIEDDLLKNAELPYIVLANHECFEDFYYLHMLSHPRNPVYVMNRYYCSGPFTGRLRKNVGYISKKLFVRDTGTIFGIKRMLRKGYPVIIYPEGRLSPDGRSNPIVEKGGRLFRKLGADIVLVGIDGGYYAHPKWRKKAYSSDVRVTVKRVLKRSELSEMSCEDVDRIIEETLYNDASLRSETIYHQKNKAEGLEGILYRCIDCGALYKTSGKGNELRCLACGAVHTLDDSYHFSDAPGSIPGYYSVIREMEEKEINSLSLKAEVTLKVFDEKMKVCKKENGICTLDKDHFGYRSDTEEFSIPTEKLPALAFSCCEEFELYHNDRLHYFYPKKDPVQAARWALAVDIMTSRRNGRTDEQE